MTPEMFSSRTLVSMTVLNLRLVSGSYSWQLVRMYRIKATPKFDSVMRPYLAFTAALAFLRLYRGMLGQMWGTEFTLWKK
eukprot:10678_1